MIGGKSLSVFCAQTTSAPADNRNVHTTRKTDLLIACRIACSQFLINKTFGQSTKADKSEATSACVRLRNNLRRLSFAAIAAPHLQLSRSMTWKIVGGCRTGTAFGRTQEVLRPRFLPLSHGETGGIVENATSTNRDSRDDLDVGVHLRVAAVDVTKFAVKLLEHGHISFHANRKGAEFGPVDLARWIHCGAANEVVQGNTRGTEF